MSKLLFMLFYLEPDIQTGFPHHYSHILTQGILLNINYLLSILLINYTLCVLFYLEPDSNWTVWLLITISHILIQGKYFITP